MIKSGTSRSFPFILIYSVPVYTFSISVVAVTAYKSHRKISKIQLRITRICIIVKKNTVNVKHLTFFNHYVFIQCCWPCLGGYSLGLMLAKGYEINGEKKNLSRVVNIGHFELSSGKASLFWQTTDRTREVVCIKLTLTYVNNSLFLAAFLLQHSTLFML